MGPHEEIMDDMSANIENLEKSVVTGLDVEQYYMNDSQCAKMVLQSRHPELTDSDLNLVVFGVDIESEMGAAYVPFVSEKNYVIPAAKEEEEEPTDGNVKKKKKSKLYKKDKVVQKDKESPFKPLSLYAQTKCDAEDAVLNSGNGIAMRLATVFGMSYRMRMDLLVNDFVYKALTDSYLVLFESHFTRNYIHVRDIANTFLFMIENYQECNNNAFNVGLTEANCTKLELANKIQKYIPDLIIVENNFKQDFDQRNYMVSNAKLESKGWKPEFSLEDGIQELIMGYQLIKKSKDKDFTNL